MKKQTIAAHELYAKLDRAFRARPMDEFLSCRVPLPFFREPPDGASANIGSFAACPKNCHAVIAEILVEMWAKYDLNATEKS
ncbi:MAG TPA: hypothetical protein VFE23_10715 [Usitatibacter sp.]|jgi:hypothetical protein|nr:hypothetical protein [Usitatibacter sp.]